MVLKKIINGYNSQKEFSKLVVKIEKSKLTKVEEKRIRDLSLEVLSRLFDLEYFPEFIGADIYMCLHSIKTEKAGYYLLAILN